MKADLSAYVRFRDRRRQKRIVRRYYDARFDNGWMMSQGGGIWPYPSYDEWLELEGMVFPSWERDLVRIRERKT